MRGTTLTNLLPMLKAEIGDYTGTNAARDAELGVLLSNKQVQLSLEYRWSFLMRRWNSVVPATTQFVTFPTVDADFGETATIDLDQLSKVEVKWASNYLDLQYGIGEDEYNAFDFSEGQVCDPIQRWREASNVDETIGPNRYEVWPVPVSQQVVRFTGQRQLLPLAAGSDKCDLDDQLLVLGVAVDILTRSKQADGQLKLASFNNRLRRLGSKNQTRDKKRILGGGIGSGDERKLKLAGLLVAIK